MERSVRLRMLLAAPVAVATVFAIRERAVLLGVIVGAIATSLEVLPSLGRDIWPLVWNNHPIYFVTDQIKLLVAVPIVAWIIRKLFQNWASSTAALG